MCRASKHIHQPHQPNPFAPPPSTICQNKELGAPELLTRQQALATLCRMCRNPEHIKEALDAGMAGSLKKLLHGESKDADASVRQQATELLFHFAGHALGRQALLSHSLIEPLAALFDDSEDVVRKNAHATLERGTTAAAVAEAVVQSGLIPTLVGKLASEVDEIKVGPLRVGIQQHSLCPSCSPPPPHSIPS